jgi:hypothetical protein
VNKNEYFTQQVRGRLLSTFLQTTCNTMFSNPGENCPAKTPLMLSQGLHYPGGQPLLCDPMADPSIQKQDETIAAKEFWKRRHCNLYLRFWLSLVIFQYRIRRANAPLEKPREETLKLSYVSVSSVDYREQWS